MAASANSAYTNILNKYSDDEKTAAEIQRLFEADPSYFAGADKTAAPKVNKKAEDQQAAEIARLFEMAPSYAFQPGQTSEKQKRAAEIKRLFDADPSYYGHSAKPQDLADMIDRLSVPPARVYNFNMLSNNALKALEDEDYAGAESFITSMDSYVEQSTDRLTAMENTLTGLKIDTGRLGQELTSQKNALSRMDEHINALAAQFGETGNTDYLLEYYTLYDNYDTLLKEYNDKYTQYEETKTAYRDALEAYPILLTQHQSESDSYADIVAMQEAGKNGGFSWKNLAYFVGAYEKAGWDELTQNPISPQFNPINYVRQGISFYSTAFTLAKALSSHDITGKDLLKILGNNVTDSLMGDLLYLTENTYLFQHFSEISPEQAWELGERTRGAVIELEKIGATVYGLAKSIRSYYGSNGVAQIAGETLTEGAESRSWYNADGSFNPPPNYGAVAGTEEVIDLQPGLRFGRYGGFTKSSDFVAELGASADSLSLPPYTNNSIYQVFEVLKPIPGVTKSIVEPWGTSTGLGTQYRFQLTIQELIDQLYIRLLP